MQIQAVSDANIELRTADLPTALGIGMAVDRALAAVLFVDPAESEVDVSFRCTLESSGIAGAPDTGERLDCQTWETEEWMLSIGTEDHEALSSRLSGTPIPETPYPIVIHPPVSSCGSRA